MINIGIHGIGDAKENFGQKWQMAKMLKVNPEDCVFFHYEDLMEGSKINFVGKLLLKLASGYYGGMLAEKGAEVGADYLNDIFTFFFGKGTRFKIEARLKELLDSYGNQTVRVFGHSMGSMILWWFGVRNPEYAQRIQCVLLGSPLGGRIGMSYLVRKFFPDVPETDIRPEFQSMSNIYSEFDPLSGHIDNFGFTLEDIQTGEVFRKRLRHREVDKYLKFYQQKVGNL